MRGNPLIGRILQDEALTRGLGDEEALLLVEWLVEQAEVWYQTEFLQVAERFVHQLCRRGRAIARFVWLWCVEYSWAAATQLAASERFRWPFPSPYIEPAELMSDILAWEGQRLNSSLK